MAKPDAPFRCLALIALAGLIGIAALALAAPARAASPASVAVGHPPAQETEAYCLSCHGKPDLSLTLPSGETLSLYVSRETLDASVHSPLGIECQACHTDIKTYPHPAISYANRRELSRSYYLACQKCHSDNYDKSLDSMHAQAAEAGNLTAPVCTDCHGAHDVRPPDQPRAHISETCGQCHTQIVEQYKNSIHGSALIEQDNPDVPVCTDCHGVHSIQDPRTAQFRIGTPELCAGCHANAELMGKYGLSTDVYNLYNISWHGVDVTVYKANWPTIWHESAVCTDCHGVHDILPTGNPASKVNPANLLATCRQCHPDAGPNWTGAWTGHNRISPERTPFLFTVERFYSTFTTLVLWLSVIYVVLQIVRAVAGRVRRSLR
jgi:predicted CXXCH cytochrome family protein